MLYIIWIFQWKGKLWICGILHTISECVFNLHPYRTLVSFIIAWQNFTLQIDQQKNAHLFILCTLIQADNFPLLVTFKKSRLLQNLVIAYICNKSLVRCSFDLHISGQNTLNNFGFLFRNLQSVTIDLFLSVWLSGPVCGGGGVFVGDENISEQVGRLSGTHSSFYWQGPMHRWPLPPDPHKKSKLFYFLLVPYVS